MSVKKIAAYCNPFWYGDFPDPFVLKVRGRYYAYATENESHPPEGAHVFPVMTSRNLVEWQSVGKAMPALGPQYHHYWAPEVTAYNGQFLLYYAVHTARFQSSIRVAVADRPEGPFFDSGHDLTGHLVPWAIDPHIFRDKDGQWYLFMTIEYWNDPGGFIGSGNVVDRLIDPFTLEGTMTRVTPPRHAWQLFEAQRQERGGVDWYTVEGPAVTSHRGRYYEMFSGGCYYRDNYAISYATAQTPMGAGGMQDTSWHDWEGKNGNALLIRGDQQYLISPGHNSLVAGPNNVDHYIVYHARQRDGGEARFPCLDRLFWHAEVMWTPAPTHTPQPAPAQPRLRELFEEVSLSSRWQEQGGRWNVIPAEVIQQDASATPALLRCQERLSPAWVLEVNLRYIAGEGCYGLSLHNDTDIFLRIAITADRHVQILASQPSAGPVRTVALPADTLIEAWHQLLITVSGSLLTIQFDGLPLVATAAELTACAFSLFTDHCRAAFSGISLTDHFCDEFLDDQQTPAFLGWEAVPSPQASSLADWRIAHGALEQTSLRSGEHILLKGQAHQHYELSATLRLLQPGAPEYAAYGVVAWQSAEGCLFTWCVKVEGGWMLAVEGTGSASGINCWLELPETFDPLSWHTLRCVRVDEQLTIYLDGPEILTTALPPQPGRAGLATRHTGAAFTDVWQTGIFLERGA